MGLHTFGALQNTDGLLSSEITSHMLTSIHSCDSGNCHNCIIADDYLELAEDGITPYYLEVWKYIFTALII
jgi:spore coat protein CotF